MRKKVFSWVAAIAVLSTTCGFAACFGDEETSSLPWGNGTSSGFIDSSGIGGINSSVQDDSSYWEETSSEERESSVVEENSSEQEDSSVLETHTHLFTVNKSNLTHHWKECACGEVAEKKTHSLENGVCTECEKDTNPTEGLTYTLSEDEKYYILTDDYGVEDTHIVIAAEYEGLPVKEIGERAFSYNETMVSVDMPDTIVCIQDNAFYKCTSLISIAIPGSVTTIADSVCKRCTNLKKVELSEGVKEIDTWAFGDCTSLTSITLPSTIESIEEWSFDGCKNLTDVTFLGHGLISIEDSVFYDCDNIRYTTYDNGMYLGNPSNPYRILMRTKENSITNCTIHQDTQIIAGAFNGCESLDSIEIPDGVISIGEKAFANCDALKTVKLSNSIKKIEEYAFWCSWRIREIEIPDSVTELQPSAFAGCANLRTLTVKEGNPVYYSVNNCVVEKATRRLVAGCETSIIPTDGSVTIIGEYAFNEHWFDSFTIPDCITAIEEGAFSWCKDLTSMEIPASVQTIGKSAFSLCTSLESVIIHNGVTTIERNAFDCCESLTSIEIPNSVISIGDYVFTDCAALTSITFKGTKAEWGAISKGESWNKAAILGTAAPLTQIVCLDGIITL